MSRLDLPIGGHCRCSAIQFEIRAAPMLTLACHCRDCQRLSASAFSVMAMIPADGFAITRGTPVARPLQGSPRHHMFCPDCMGWIHTKIDGIDARLNVHATLCHDASWTAPFVEIRTKDKHRWAATSAPHAYHDAPDPAEFRQLLNAFPAWFRQSCSPAAGDLRAP